ncbi:MAG: 1,4-alpha-glucan branching protein GlgB [Desulfomicrobium sp.]|nr:1,4-alpha-glucan branching protein GlgB [Desulfomicrobium sp.]NLV97605.1 1,4-alpha-glucan branching protein GlgB [Desulfovibrionales bacterium]
MSMSINLGDLDVYLFKQGRHTRLYEHFGAHPETVGPENRGTRFVVWAPNASSVSVIGDFNAWDRSKSPMNLRADSSGIWECFVPDAYHGQRYKYFISWPEGEAERSDPFALFCEEPPQTASIIWDLQYSWNDQEWMQSRWAKNSLQSAWSIYEVHLGSWRRDEHGHFMNYRRIAHELADYVLDAGFTHVEIMPVAEHPFYGSWGYQSTGYFAPSSRYGCPQDFRYFVDHLHQRGLGVILDWVPGHFPLDDHGLANFDGTALYEHADPKQGFHPEWKSAIFNYGRYEVAGFLICNALYWLREFHLDGLRVDGVASMLYLDYSRSHNEWIPNKHGGRENLAAIEMLQELNQAVYAEFPDVQTIAEESTSWPMVSRPVYLGGLGFGLKWNMGWMNDSLSYMEKDPVYRKFHHNLLTFAMWYAYAENFVLPLSHDEVVHGKKSILSKMPGDYWQKMAGLRLLLGYMYGIPGKKLLFMGTEFGQWHEWNHDQALPWELLNFPVHDGLRAWVRDLNRVYRTIPALYVLDFDPQGFAWENCHDAEQSIISFFRKDDQGHEILVVCNFTPVSRENYAVGVERSGWWKEVLNSNSLDYGGSGSGNMGQIRAEAIPVHDRPYSLNLYLPPLGVLFLEPHGE